MKKKQDERHFLIGVPEAIAGWLAGLTKPNRHHERAMRFVEFGKLCDENSEKLRRYWKQIERSAKSEDSLISFFITMPDGPTDQAFTGEHMEFGLAFCQESIQFSDGYVRIIC